MYRIMSLKISLRPYFTMYVAFVLPHEYPPATSLSKNIFLKSSLGSSALLKEVLKLIICKTKNFCFTSIVIHQKRSFSGRCCSLNHWSSWLNYRATYDLDIFNMFLRTKGLHFKRDQLCMQFALSCMGAEFFDTHVAQRIRFLKKNTSELVFSC